mmetsp:Transcript_86/g.94  ORF Transcript_86/g.94 Transcript_86/m.94 type:complete len:179 (-) Transcript_86:15-551(-)|eukprot:CAMPEP_0117758628 /NCGR_PEP_ID=MMETSP0947-20121206/15501_1 /TAXON_ID=44440 /ORGANISM="Chattonella subsalsa, Strain CCMP2191" /LENGTH=178 /DNA_ID=CAMNT_0005578871 /DNA_START=76 /DNA_END=612 /DNA_ORIENTATION=-
MQLINCWCSLSVAILIWLAQFSASNAFISSTRIQHDKTFLGVSNRCRLKKVKLDMSPDEFITVIPADPGLSSMSTQPVYTPKTFAPQFDPTAFGIFIIFVGLFTFEVTLNNMARDRQMDRIRLDKKERERLQFLLMGEIVPVSLEKEIDELQKKSLENYIMIGPFKITIFPEKKDDRR